MVQDPMPVRPYKLLCAVCALGRGERPEPKDPKLAAFLRAVRADPSRSLRLVCNVGTIYAWQDPGRAEDTPEGELFNDKRDLDILQKLGLAPGDARPAYDLFESLLREIEDADEICGGGDSASSVWKGCALAGSGGYRAGRALGIDAILPRRSAAERTETKKRSVRTIESAAVLEIRPHHLMCMTCFHAGRPKEEMAPIAADNLQEAIRRMQEDPSAPVRLIDGCCMICPPCALYDMEKGICVGGDSMALRDRKKDLDVLKALDLSFGDVLPAAVLLRRLYERVRTTTQICGYGDGRQRSPEWRVCGGPQGREEYRRGRAVGMGVPGAAPNEPPTERKSGP